MKVHAIIVAAGSGTRAGSTKPKQFRTLLGKPVYSWSVDTFLAHDAVTTVVLVLPEGQETPENTPDDKRLLFASGGPARADSVRNGLKCLTPADEDLVLVHDAARPGLEVETITRLIEALQDQQAAAPALPVIDALKKQDGAHLETVSRDRLYRIQTPQAFRASLLSEALNLNTDAFVDDLAAVEHLGAEVRLVPGKERLAKITFEEDFERMEKLLQPAGPAIRVGSGYDVHAFEPGDHVTLCGVRIAHEHKLAGHSDADVGWHALTDAIFGALALGDLGDHFPPSDPKWKDADSAVFLRHALSLADQAGWALTSCDITLICEAPKVKPHREAMREATAALAGLHPGAVSIKATTTEGLGFTGRREGIAAQAVAVLSRIQ